MSRSSKSDDGHGYNKPRREAAYRWFTRWLQGAENTEPEAPLTLATAEELQCTPHRAGADRVSRRRRCILASIANWRSNCVRAGSRRRRASANSRARVERIMSLRPAPVRITTFGEVDASRMPRGKTDLRKRARHHDPGAAVRAERRTRAQARHRLCRRQGQIRGGRRSGATGGARATSCSCPDLRGLRRNAAAPRPARLFRPQLRRLRERADGAADRQDDGRDARGRRGRAAWTLLAARSDVDASRIAVVGRGGARFRRCSRRCSTTASRAWRSTACWCRMRRW